MKDKKLSESEEKSHEMLKKLCGNSKDRNQEINFTKYSPIDFKGCSSISTIIKAIYVPK